MYKDIIWDFDGTLFDTYPSIAWAFKKALAEEGVNQSEEEILKLIKISITHGIEFYRDNFNIDTKGFGERFREYENEIDVGKVLPFPHVKEICSRIVSSGGSNFIVTHRGESIANYLEQHGFSGLFTDIVIKEHGFKRKPDPEAFTYIIEKYDIDKKTALAVGDRELDLLAAKNAGIKACLFDMEESDFGDKADYVINSIEELEDIIF
jgi:phosphoglycolate phosphatase-like HAD superfamily hydrolase